MGLDMYLYLNKYESQFDNKKLTYPRELATLKEKIRKRNFLSKETSYQVGYWRKFNALHSYIVNKLADGEDKCQDIYINRKNLKEMLEILKKVEKSFDGAEIVKQNEDYIAYKNPVAEELLPTQSGFFFGGLEYDTWYLRDVRYAIELFEDVLKVLEKDKKGLYSVYYRASW